MIARDEKVFVCRSTYVRHICHELVLRISIGELRELRELGELGELLGLIGDIFAIVRA